MAEQDARPSRDGVMAKWWNGDWQYRLQVRDVEDKDLHWVGIESRAPGGSRTKEWGSYAPAFATEGIEPDGDLGHD